MLLLSDNFVSTTATHYLADLASVDSVADILFVCVTS